MFEVGPTHNEHPNEQERRRRKRKFIAGDPFVHVFTLSHCEQNRKAYFICVYTFLYVNILVLGIVSRIRFVYSLLFRQPEKKYWVSRRIQKKIETYFVCCMLRIAISHSLLIVASELPSVDAAVNVNTRQVEVQAYIKRCNTDRNERSRFSQLPIFHHDAYEKNIYQQ